MPRSRVRLFLMMTLFGAAATAGSFTACIPTYTFGDGGAADSGQDVTAATDAGPGNDANLDAPADSPVDAPTTVDAPFDSSSDAPPDSALPDAGVAVAVVAVGSMAGSTGYGYQTHLVFAQNDGRYWFFYVDDTTGVIKTLHSPDLSTWTAGASISLGSGYGLTDGYNFSVAYANLGGTDVVHLVADATNAGNYSTLHLRATIAGGALTASAASVLPDTTNGGSCPNDGPATAIAPGGQVYDVTAWALHSAESTTCDTNIYRSPTVDTGATWGTGTFWHDGYYVSVPTFAFSHDLLTLPDAGAVMLLYPDEDNDSTDEFFAIGWDLSSSFAIDAGAPGTTGEVEDAATELFASAGKQSSWDDWSACNLGGTNVHVVRHVLGSTDVGEFEEEIYQGAGWQAAASAPPTSASVSNTGVVLLSNASASNGMLLVTLGIDGSLNLARWTSSGWSTLGSIAGDGNVRQSLAGSGCGSAHPMLFWTETVGTVNTIESLDLSGYL